MSKRASARARSNVEPAQPETDTLSVPAKAESVDLTLTGSPADSSDVELLSPTRVKAAKACSAAALLPSTPAAATPAPAKKPLHPFFSVGKKKPPVTPAAAAAGEERKETSAAFTTPLAKAAANGGSPTIMSLLSPSSANSPSVAGANGPPPSPLLPVRCELDSLYAGKPAAEFFLTPKEKVVVKVKTREEKFVASIADEEAERKRIIASFQENGKKREIHPFLQPKTPSGKERCAAATGTGAGSGAAVTAKTTSEFAGVQFAAEEAPFPSVGSLQGSANPAAADGGSPPLQWGDAWQHTPMHMLSAEESCAHAKPLPISAPNQFTPLRAAELTTLSTLAASSSAAVVPALPPSLPLWVRPPTGPGAAAVDYLSAPSFRSSDVSSYLAQPRAQSFLRDVVAKLAQLSAGSSPEVRAWALEQVQRLARRLLIRRVHCFRAMQRDEQQAAAIRKQREADRESGDGTSQSVAAPASSSSRSDRAAQRGHKTEAAISSAHGDEQVSHTFQARPDSLWSEQYRAYKSDEMFGGNEAQRAQVRDWLHSWSLRQQNEEENAAAAAAHSSGLAAPAAAASTSAPRRKKKKFVYYSDESDFDDDGDEYNPRASPVPVASSAPTELVTTLLLVGPPTGKTSLVYACCHESDTGIIEIGANARRAQRDVLAKCEEATQSHRLALIAQPGGAGAAVAAAASSFALSASKGAVAASPVKGKTSSSAGKKSSVKKVEASPKKAVTKAPSFNFFDAAAQKKHQAELAAASAAAPPSRKRAKSKSDDRSSDDDFSLSPKPTVKKKLSAAAAVAAVPTPSAAAAPVKAASVSKKSLFAAKTQSKMAAIKGAPEELLSDSSGKDSDGEGKGAAKKRKSTAAGANHKHVSAADFFSESAAPSVKKPKVKSVPVSGTPFAAAPAQSVDPLAPVARTSSQTTILFEEVDVVFPLLDRKFLAGVRALVSNAKRPIVLTASEITRDMQEALDIQTGGDANATVKALDANGMPLIEVIRFEQPRSLDLLPYVFLIVAVEVGFHSAETLARLPSLAEVQQLLQFNQCDVRRTLLALQLSVTSTPLTMMLGSDNLIQAAANPVAAAAAVKKRAAQLRLYPAERTSQQDLVLAQTGLLRHKEELLAVFDPRASDTFVQALVAPPATGAKAAVKASSLPDAAASAALTLTQTEALLTSHTQDMQLMHLNYLPALTNALSQPAAGAAAGSTTAAESLLSQLPLRLAALPKTAEDTLVLEEIQLPPELLAVMPEPLPEAHTESVASSQSTGPGLIRAPSGNAAVSSPATTSLPSSTPPPRAPASPPKPTPTAAPVVAPPLSDFASAWLEDEDAAILSELQAVTNGDAEAVDSDVEDDEEEEEGEDEDAPMAGPSSHRKKRIVLDEEEGEEEHSAADNADDDEEEVEDLDVTSALLAEQKKRDAYEKTAQAHMQRALDALRKQQRTTLREQLLVQEEKRREHVRASNRELQLRSPNQLLQRSIVLLDDMAALADTISAIDASQYHSDASLRSHSRYHPAVHSAVTSASRDFYPLYLESVLPSSSGWPTLEQQWADEIEEDNERGDRDTRSGDDKRQSLAGGLGSLMPSSLGAGGADKTKVPSSEAWEDRPQPERDSSLDMASSLDVQAAHLLRSTTRQLLAPQAWADEARQLAKLDTHSVPSMAFYPSLSDLLGLPTTAPSSSSASGAILIDVSDSPSPAVAPRPLFLPSVDVSCVSAGGKTEPLSIRAFSQPAGGTAQFRREMSALAERIWDNLHAPPHLFTSASFLLDLLPFVRGWVCLALDSTSGGALAAQEAAADAALAASLQARDGGRASRRNTRALQSSAPKLSRRWQQVSDCFWKNSAAETVRTLQTCAWRAVDKRPLQLHHIWHSSMMADAAVTASSTVAAPVAPAPHVTTTAPSAAASEAPQQPAMEDVYSAAPLLPTIAEASQEPSQEPSQQQDVVMVL